MVLPPGAGPPGAASASVGLEIPPLPRGARANTVGAFFETRLKKWGLWPASDLPESQGPPPPITPDPKSHRATTAEHRPPSGALLVRR